MEVRSVDKHAGIGAGAWQVGKHPAGQLVLGWLSSFGVSILKQIDVATLE